MCYNIYMKITQEQINVVLQAVYQTNVSASTFDALKKLFSELPKINEPAQNEEAVK